ncbi:MAG: hypothetical protein H7Y61_15425, partial [Rhizobiales bacterium]|nr:hypothetical protein [Rhizobacter sp.]
IAESSNPDLLTVQGDIGSPATGRRVVEAAIDRFGRIDLLGTDRLAVPSA